MQLIEHRKHQFADRVGSSSGRTCAGRAVEPATGAISMTADGAPPLRKPKYASTAGNNDKRFTEPGKYPVFEWGYSTQAG